MLSVVVPTYNRASLLPRCIDSILAQEYSEFELIVVDDGSTDGTHELMADYCENDSRVRFVEQSNAGAGVARNHGARLANGDYILFLDSDDEAKPGWLAAIVELIETRPAVACCGIEFRNADGSLLRTRNPNVQSAPGGCGGLYQSGTFAVRADVFGAIGGYVDSLQANQHSEFRMRLFEHVREHHLAIAGTDQVLVIAHDHAGEKIRSNDRAVLESAAYVLETHSALLTGSSYADWAATAGHSAARLAEYRNARRWFRKAIRANPKKLKNYVRWLAATIPVVRGRAHRKAVADGQNDG